ncbi:FtsX-like permease family protein [Streptacidiphilus sp. EB129]|uniref:FtsX-like permease family protein n=1 Tax=Streptacidiphilus sp. EB129 TaxID=3156262 RepID=UPI0035140686
MTATPDVPAAGASTSGPDASGPDASAPGSPAPDRGWAPVRRRPRSVAPWTRTRLRSAPGAAVALMLLVAVTVLLAAGFPRAYDRYQDSALDKALAGTPLSARAVEGRLSYGGPGQRPLQDADSSAPAALLRTRDGIAPAITPPLRVRPVDVSYGLHSTGINDRLDDPWLPRPEDLAPVLTLDWQADLAAQVRMVSGRLPQGPPGDWPGPTPVLRFGTAPPLALEVAVSAGTATIMHLKTGSVLHLSPDFGRRAVLTVVGVYQPLQPGAAFWQGEPRLRQPTFDVHVPLTQDRLRQWHMEAVVGAGANPYLADLGGIEEYWWFPVAAGQLHAYEIPAAQSELSALTTGADSGQANGTPGIPQGVELSSSLPIGLAAFSAHSGALDPVLTVGGAGAAGVAGAVLLMAAGLAADRREEELRLLRARGAGLTGLGLRLLAETGCCVLLGGGLGLAGALLLFPGPRWQAPVAAAAAPALLTLLAVPLRALARHRRIRAAGRAEDVTTARPSRRRTVLEVSVLVVAAAAGFGVRRQGLPAGDGPNLLLSAAPVLLGLAGALLLMRVYPWPLRAVARPTARRGGAVAFLGLARAGRASATASVLPLLAMLLALTVGVFGSELLSDVGTARAQAALLQVGADARVDGAQGPLPAALVAAVRRSPGVRTVQPVLRGTVPISVTGTAADLYGVDPAGYAAMSRPAGEGFDPARLAYAGTGPIPVLASPDVAQVLGGAPFPVQDEFGTFEVRVVGTLAGTPAGRSSFVLAPAAALTALPRPQQGADAPTTLLIDGPVDGAALRAVVDRTSGPSLTDVQVRAELLAQLGTDPLQTGAARLYLASVLAAALLCVVAVLLALLQAAPGRSALLARLRTMGLTPRQGYALILVEALPQVLAGVLAGTALGAASIPLLSPAVDLSALVGATVDSGLQAEPLPLLLPGAALLLLTVGVVSAEAAVLGRRQIGTELRAGDRR